MLDGFDPERRRYLDRQRMGLTAAGSPSKKKALFVGAAAKQRSDRTGHDS